MASIKYSVYPTVTAYGERAISLQNYLGAEDAHEAEIILLKKGYPAHLGMDVGEVWFDFHSFGQVDESLGIEGVYRAFADFLDTVGHNINPGGYTLMTSSGESIFVAVG